MERILTNNEIADSNYQVDIAGLSEREVAENFYLCPMELIYIYHSGFVIEGSDFSLLIDYYQDTPDRFVHTKFLNRPGRLYILASHSHPDHFTPEILEWRNVRPDIQYIFSEDIRNKGQACFHDAIYLRKGEEWGNGQIRIKAFGSTDIGISFLIDIDNIRIFHAGDLNNWHWEEESTPEEIQEAQENYFRELETLSRETSYLDLALFPVDPRLGKDYPRGARQFIDRIQTHQFAPMHFWEKYAEANAFRDYAEAHGGRFIAIHKPGEVIKLETKN